MTFSPQLLESLAVTSCVRNDRDGSEPLPAMHAVSDDSGAADAVGDDSAELRQNFAELLKKQGRSENVRLWT